MSTRRFLSHELSAATPVFGDNPPVTVTVERDFDSAPCLQHMISTVNHNGTHVDVPRHFVPGGRTLSDFGPAAWFFDNVTLVDVPAGDDRLIGAADLAAALAGSLAAPERVEALMVRTGFGAHRSTDPDRYVRSNPGFGADAARFLRSTCPDLRAVFVDAPSCCAANHVEDGLDWHRRMLEDDGAGRCVLLFEDVLLPPGLTTPAQVIALPLRVAGLDGAPVTVVAVDA